MIFQPVRYFLARFSSGTDLIPGLCDFCRQNAISTAVFNLSGAVTCCTLGNYDQKQLVFVTSKKEAFLEIVSCSGNVCRDADGTFHVQAQAVLADEKGRLTGGCVFSETLLFTGELQLQEIIGPPLTRQYDEETGRMLFMMKS
jgi:hypothetical protein